MTATLNPSIMKSIEQLDYQVTVGDVAAQAGLEINLAQQGLLVLASEAGGHLQVADSGEMVFLFPKNYRTILRNKYWRLRLQETWEKIWKVLFYLIRISFGIVLIASIILMMVAIAAILIAVNSGKESNNSSNDSGGGFFFIPTDIFWIFTTGDRYDSYEHSGRKSRQVKGQLNFLEAVFSFLFGDGNPNSNLDEKRWQEIGSVIRNYGGAVTAEQIAPYLDNITPLNQETEDYILPVLARFNGYPQVSPEGDIIYYFPELQVMAKQRRTNTVSQYLQEKLWRFSQAESSQIILSIGLGGVYIILALVLGSLFRQYVVDIALVSFVQFLYPALLAYGIGFLAIPLIRYFWIQAKNKRIEARNQQRQARANQITHPNQTLRQKLQFARQFANQTVITEADIAYSTDQDLLEQEANRSDKIDQEWQKHLDSK
ncbi:MAG: hypothetical protein VKJ02_19290 [Snowella sp.]|nr:hypothetical protein [Snowella sp.]